ncbi:hypothetical protein BH23BAC3_BH23BAC3_31230 [soil metagenome]
MAEKDLTLCDTNILIELTKDNPDIMLFQHFKLDSAIV